MRNVFLALSLLPLLAWPQTRIYPVVYRPPTYLHTQHYVSGGTRYLIADCFGSFFPGTSRFAPNVRFRSSSQLPVPSSGSNVSGSFPLVISGGTLYDYTSNASSISVQSFTQSSGTSSHSFQPVSCVNTLVPDPLYCTEPSTIAISGGGMFQAAVVYGISCSYSFLVEADSAFCGNLPDGVTSTACNPYCAETQAEAQAILENAKQECESEGTWKQGNVTDQGMNGWCLTGGMCDPCDTQDVRDYVLNSRKAACCERGFEPDQDLHGMCVIPTPSSIGVVDYEFTGDPIFLHKCLNVLAGMAGNACGIEPVDVCAAFDDPEACLCDNYGLNCGDPDGSSSSDGDGASSSSDLCATFPELCDDGNSSGSSGDVSSGSGGDGPGGIPGGGGTSSASLGGSSGSGGDGPGGSSGSSGNSSGSTGGGSSGSAGGTSSASGGSSNSGTPGGVGGGYGGAGPMWCDRYPNDPICKDAGYDEHCDLNPADPFCAWLILCSQNPHAPECQGPQPPPSDSSRAVSCRDLKNCDWSTLETQLKELGVAQAIRDSLASLFEWLKRKHREDSLLAALRWLQQGENERRFIEVGETIAGRIYTSHQDLRNSLSEQLGVLQRMDSMDGLYYSNSLNALQGGKNAIDSLHRGLGNALGDGFGDVVRAIGDLSGTVAANSGGTNLSGVLSGIGGLRDGLAAVSDGVSGGNSLLGKLDSTLAAGNSDILSALDSLGRPCVGDECGNYDGIGDGFGADDFGIDTTGGIGVAGWDSLFTAPGSRGLQDSVAAVTNRLRAATATPFIDNYPCPVDDLSFNACEILGSDCTFSVCDSRLHVQGRHVLEWVGVFMEFLAWVLFLVGIA